MKLTLHVGTKNWSSWSLRAWLAVKASGLAFEERYVQLRHEGLKAELASLSPSRLVPLLTVENGDETFQVWDSLAIGESIAEFAPEAGLLPADRTARAKMRSIVAEMHSGFMDLRRQLPMDFARLIPGITPTEETAANIARIQNIWNECLGTQGGPYLMGAHFTLADASYAPVVSRFRTYGVPLQGQAAAYAERIWQHPFMQDWLKGAEAEIADGRAS